MDRPDRLVRIPPPLQRGLLILGIAWVLLVWLAGVIVWAIGLAIAAAYAWTVSRRVVNVTLQPFSKERGIVIWAYYRKHATGARPRIVWDDDEPAPPSVG